MKIKVSIIALILMIMCMNCLSGCDMKKDKVEKLKDLDFTVMDSEDIPEELVPLIEEKKQDPFKLTYSDSKFLYIVVGYGEQPTGGYSITVDQLYLTDNAIYIDTSLIGPSKNEIVTQALTYPYVVVKMEYMDKSVVFN